MAHSQPSDAIAPLVLSDAGVPRDGGASRNTARTAPAWAVGSSMGRSSACRSSVDLSCRTQWKAGRSSMGQPSAGGPEASRVGLASRNTARTSPARAVWSSTGKSNTGRSSVDRSCRHRSQAGWQSSADRSRPSQSRAGVAKFHQPSAPESSALWAKAGSSAAVVNYPRAGGLFRA
jgi:hypothetical protein